MTAAVAAGYQGLDFDKLDEEADEFLQEEVFLTKKRELGFAAALKSLKDEFSETLSREEEVAVKAFTSSADQFNELDLEIDSCDGNLEKIEKVLSKFEDDLSQTSSSIQKLQTDSMTMNTRLRNKKAGHALLRDYTNSLVLTQELVRGICEDPVDERYLEHVSDLDTKLAALKNSDMALQSHHLNVTQPELQRLRVMAIQKVRDFLFAKITGLKKPKTNIQILQQTVLGKFQKFQEFLMNESANVVAREVQAYYCETMQRVYLHQFRTYFMSLAKLQLEWMPEQTDVVCANLGRPEGAGGGGLFGFMQGSSRPLLSQGPVLSEKQNVFSLDTRVDLLEKLDSDPIVAHVRETGTGEIVRKYYPEHLMRSHQRLLVDAACSEYSFIDSFFGSDSAPQVWKETFQPTLDFFSSEMEEYLSNCWDSVGLLLKIRVVEYHKRLLDLRRRFQLLDPFLDRLLLMLWPALKRILNENIKSFAVDMQSIAPTKDTHPHFVARRYAELSASLSTLRCPIEFEVGPVHHKSVFGGAAEPYAASRVSQQTLDADQIIVDALRQLQQQMVNLLKNLAKALSDEKKQKIFLINNYDLILTIFYERQQSKEDIGICQPFESLLREQVASFIEQMFTVQYKNLIEFVMKYEREEGSENPPMVEINSIQSHFKDSWKKAMSDMSQYIMTSFSNFNNGNEILKQVLTQLLLYYTRFQKICHKRKLVVEFVPNATILQEIKTYSRAF